MPCLLPHSLPPHALPAPCLETHAVCPHRLLRPSPDEHAEGAKRWWKNVPFAFMGEKGPVLNRQWKPYLMKALPNKMSRVILVRVILVSATRCPV